MKRRTFLQRSSLIAGAILLPGALVAPGIAAAQDANIIKIVSSLPRTGSSKTQTDTIANAIRMALDEAGNQVSGYTIVYEDMDDATAARGAWDPAKEAENAITALNDPDVMVYIGTFNSGAAKVSIPILNPANLVMISPANTYPGLTKPGKGEPNEPDVYRPSGMPNYTRVVPADDIQGAVGANWAKELGASKVFVLDDAELYGKGIADVFRATAEQIGLPIVGNSSIDGRASDYRALAQRIRSTGADFVYFGGITQNNAGKLWVDIKAATRGIILMGPDGILEEEFIKAAGDASEGTFVTFGGPLPETYQGAALGWLTRYKDRFGAEPEAYAIYGYEAAKVALDAIFRAGVKDRAAIRDAVFATQGFDGVLGNWSFDANGDTSNTLMTGQQILGGKFRFIKQFAVE